MNDIGLFGDNEYSLDLLGKEYSLDLLGKEYSLE